MKTYKQLVESWQQKMNEVGYSQRHYQITAILTFSKNAGGEITEKVREVRAIPNITTVTNLGTITENENFYKAVYGIKFVIIQGENMEEYIRTIFKVNISHILGVRLNKIQKIDDLTTPD